MSNITKIRKRSDPIAALICGTYAGFAIISVRVKEKAGSDYNAYWIYGPRFCPKKIDHIGNKT